MVQFIYLRRDIQNRLDRLRSRIDRQMVQTLAARLNSNDRLAAMWEVMLLSAVPALLEVEAEPHLENGKRPDMRITGNWQDRDIDLLAEVTSVSDAGIDRNNPVDALLAEIRVQARSAGLSEVTFDWRVGDRRESDSPRSRIRLELPNPNQLTGFVKSKVIPVLREWQSTGKAGQKHYIQEDGIDLEMTYRPGAWSVSGGHLAYYP